MAVFAHTLFGFDWTTAGILGAAVAPTDPAVMFSVLGGREIAGRSGTILKGESGANDPVGIALMIGMLDFATSDHGTFWTVVKECAVEMSVGLAIGFVAGLCVGGSGVPHERQIEQVQTSLASVAEVVVFAGLGLTVDLGSLDGRLVWVDGILLAALLAFVARPIVVGPLLVPVRLRWGERVFIVWGGLKGAVPILLAAFAVIAGVADAQRIYGLVFVVVLCSVVVQGTSLPFVATRLGVPMRVPEPEPSS
jgi:cell volume regulation protein A